MLYTTAASPCGLIYGNLRFFFCNQPISLATIVKFYNEVNMPLRHFLEVPIPGKQTDQGEIGKKLAISLIINMHRGDNYDVILLHYFRYIFTLLRTMKG